MHVRQDEENDGERVGLDGCTEPLAHLRCLQPFAFHHHCHTTDAFSFAAKPPCSSRFNLYGRRLTDRLRQVGRHHKLLRRTLTVDWINQALFVRFH